jgi:hypothetical protein
MDGTDARRGLKRGNSRTDEIDAYNQYALAKHSAPVFHDIMHCKDENIARSGNSIAYHHWQYPEEAHAPAYPSEKNSLTYTMISR